jgi:hypothetical protein
MPTTTTRRAILAGAAGVPALAVPAIATEPDPIFAAIEAHKAAWRAYVDFIRAPAYAGVVQVPPDLEQRAGELLDEVHRVAETILDVRPMTVGGVISLLDYLYECDREVDGCFPAARYIDEWRHSREGLSFHGYACKIAADALQAVAARHAAGA